MRTKGRVLVAVAAALALGLMLSGPALAHGVNIEYTSEVQVSIVAKYDNGEPMAGAQVAVYAPDEPSTPWLTGECDEEGRFSFTPDTSRPGIWDVQVRLAGHGAMVHIPVGEGTASTGGVGGYGPLQLAVMVACVVWGSIGTALYFSRRRRA